MAVDDINNTNPVLPAALQGRVQAFVPLAASLLSTVKNPVAVATAATQNLTPAQQAALLGSEAVQTLNREPTSPAEPLLAEGTALDLAAVTESEGLSPARQAALAANETVQTALEAQNLTPAQRAALTVNQATQTLAAPLTLPETAIPTTTAGVAGQNLPPAPEETMLPAGAPTEVAATGVPPGTAAVAPTEPGVSETTIAREALNPAQPAAAQTIQYQNAFAVYEVRNPTPPPPAPGEVRRELQPAVPIGRARPVDPLVLRQAWEKRKKNRRGEIGPVEATGPRPPLAEKALRELVRQANEDLAASGVPLHLVLARHEESFALDIYECSDDARCEVTQEIPLDLDNLLTVLDNLEHETGIIVNIRT